MNGMIIGMMKRRIEKYQDIVIDLLNNNKLSKEQEEFLEKEKIKQ